MKTNKQFIVIVSAIVVILLLLMNTLFQKKQTALGAADPCVIEMAEACGYEET